ncbi:peroxisomal 2 4-dienoyl-CoA reductase sps19 [Extremus antarcticus]|uniref:2,4-dienoyl-CoA reductase [(3E)-enoyl-CoA-producing] n=1 Tax=Extremus antarcticus TaxID=702011 RepID=A0AAJ0D4X0_9PEZI|nr:peroxisomal 2 4-dienoyl-CoA reductase sps19 [Extremus antarcticus]
MASSKSGYVSDVWKDSIFDGKVVFCTGGSGSICSAQVRALVHLGADACIVGRNEEKAKAKADDIATVRSGAKVLGIGNVDVRSSANLQSAVEQCVRELGRIDFVIAGAAGNFLAPIRSLSPNAFKAVIDIDVLGSFNTVKATLPHVIASAKAGGVGGRYILVGANMFQTGLPLQTHVGAAKSAVNALSSHMAIELGPLGVTSNVIAPGPIGDTEGMDRLTPASDVDKASSAKIPLGRMGRVRDIADATVYLFSDAGSYVNGDVLIVDGGAWHTGGGAPGHTLAYPEFLISKEEVGRAVVGAREAKM